MRERLSLFPMSRDMCAVARYADMLEGYELTHLFVPKYLRMGEDDVSCLDGGTYVGLSLTDYSKEKLMECDVLYMDYDENMASVDLYKKILAHASEVGVEVILSRMLMQMLDSELINPYPDYGASFAASSGTDFLYEISIPVVMVLSHGVYTDQLAVELALRQHFAKAGFNVGQIGSHDACKLFGFTGMPDFMVMPADAYDKTVRFNRYVADMVKNEKYEIMIIGAPGSIMKYSDSLLQGLGVLPSIVCNAVRSDVSIACTYYGKYKKLYFDEMCKYGKYRMDSPIHFFSVSNTAAGSDLSSQDATRLNYTSLKSSFVLSTIKNIEVDDDYYLLNALDKDSITDACIAVHNTLSGNASFMR